jgi:hypothetical protein
VAARRGCDAFPSTSPTLLRNLLAIGAVLIPALITIAVPPVQAQDELLINDDRLPRAQFAPRPARGLSGSVVIVWSDGRNGADASIDYDIYAVTIRDPQALGSTVNRRINDDVGGAFQGSPDIASSPTGTLFCVWEDNRASNPDVYGAALDSLGFRTTPNLRINDDTGFGEQRSPHVTPVGADHYLVVWGDQRAGQSDIYGSYRNVSGAPLGPNFIISPDPVTGGSFQGEPAVVCNASGLTLVVWLDGREGGSVFGATFDIYGQWIDAAGSLIGGNFKINSTTGAQQDSSPTVVADPTLGFVVGWIDRRLGTSIDPGDVYAQRFGPDRSLVGVNVRVNDDPLGRNQKNVRSAQGPDGAYLFWEDQRDAFGLDSNVLSARVAYDSSAPGANFRVNANTPGRQGTPSAVWDGRDAFLTTWEDSRNGAPDVYAISFLPNGTRRGFDTQMNDDAARNDQWRPRLGRGNGEFLLTWIDRRHGTNDLFGQWVGANGGREGTNSLLYQDTGLTRPVASNAAVAPNGTALVAAQVTRDSDAGEIRGFLFLTMGNGPAFTFWISDSLPSTQAEPVVAARPGEFAVAWIDSRGTAPTIYGQRISAGGARLGVNHPLLSVEPVDPPYALDLALDDFAGGYWLLYAEGASADQRLWLAHLDSSLQPDGAPVAVAPGLAGPRQDPKLSTSPEDGRLEVVWQGLGASGLGAVYHLALTSGLVPLGPVFEVGDPGFTGARTAPSIFLLDSRSVVTWQERRDGNWSIWMRELEGGMNPVSGAVRVDEDPGQADQLEPGVGMDAAGNAIFVWADLRSTSSGSDILARVIELTPTSVDDLPAPEPEPPPAPPSRMRLGAARPNPFGGTLRVPLEVPAGPGARVRAYVLDVRGALVATVYDGDAGGGRLLLRWNGVDGRGREVASGVYWFVAESGGERHAVRLVRIR